MIRNAESMVKGRDMAVALVQVPSRQGDEVEKREEARPRFAVGKLSTSRRWVVQTPKVLVVEGGVVIGTGVQGGVGPLGPTSEKE